MPWGWVSVCGPPPSSTFDPFLLFLPTPCYLQSASHHRAAAWEKDAMASRRSGNQDVHIHHALVLTAIRASLSPAGVAIVPLLPHVQDGGKRIAVARSSHVFQFFAAANQRVGGDGREIITRARSRERRKNTVRTSSDELRSVTLLEALYPRHRGNRLLEQRSVSIHPSKMTDLCYNMYIDALAPRLTSRRKDIQALPSEKRVSGTLTHAVPFAGSRV